MLWEGLEGIWGHLGGFWEAFGGIWEALGGSWVAFGDIWDPKPSLKRFWGGFWQILGDLGCPLGLLGAPFWAKMAIKIEARKTGPVSKNFWEGGSSGDPRAVQILQNQALAITLHTPCSPFRGAANPKASPLPPAPLATS